MRCFRWSWSAGAAISPIFAEGIPYGRILRLRRILVARCLPTGARRMKVVVLADFVASFYMSWYHGPTTRCCTT
jgi:hypothetical protein